MNRNDNPRLNPETFPEIFWISGPEGQIIYLNPRWYGFTGLECEQSLGSGWQSAVHPRDLITLALTFQESLQKETSFEGRFRLRRKDGAYRWFISKAHPQFNVRNKIVSWFWLNLELEKRPKAIESKPEFLASVGHDIRTPLGAILGFSEILLGDKVSAQDHDRYLKIIHRNGERLSDFISELLDFLKIEKNRTRPDNDKISR